MKCLITGSSLGIGANLALKMASLGYDLYLTYYQNKESALKLQQKIQKEYVVDCNLEYCDLKKEDNIKKVISNIKKKWGYLDILVNNASCSKDNLISSKTKQEFMEVLEVNLVGTFLMSKHASAIMNKEGIIINMSSTDGVDTQSIYNIDYAASKAGVISLTKSFSLAYPGFKIIGIIPNWVDTESTREMNQDYLESELKRIGQKRLISKEEVVEKIIHTIVDKKIKTGSLIRIDGDCDE